jgi:putative toxin-antitoxin system antitoxin component (TIGR02293 family)
MAVVNPRGVGRKGGTTRRPTPAAGSLGVTAGNPLQLIEQIRSGLRYHSLEHFQEVSRLPIEGIRRVLSLPRRTLARRKEAGKLSAAESDRLVRLADLFDKAVDLFDGDRDAALRWFQSPAKAFAWATPLAVAETETGAREVEKLIGRLDHGVFS